MSVGSKSLSIDKLKNVGWTIREHIIRMTTAAGSGHPKHSHFLNEIVTELDLGGIMKYGPKKPIWAGPDLRSDSPQRPVDIGRGVGFFSPHFDERSPLL